MSWRDIFAGFLMAAFFVSTLALSFFSERIFVSPDENAAFFFAKQFAETSTLSAVEPLNAELDNILHPRSMVVVGQLLLPISFLGLPVMAGLVGKLFGDGGMLLVTPFLALLTILAWRKIALSLFKDPKFADWAAFFLMVHPAFWYYSGRVMMHNVAFVAFLVFAAYFAVTKPLSDAKSRFRPELKHIEFFLSGLFVSLALAMRTAEALWVVGAFVILLAVYRAQIGWRNVASAFLGLGAILFGVCVINAFIYGGPFVTGYTVGPNIFLPADGNASLSAVWTLLFPFGIHELAILRHVFHYGFLLYPWMTVPAMIGIIMVVASKFEKNTTWRVITVLTLALSAWLGIIYGSWNFFDNPDPRALTLGNSYVRYWLPLFILASLFAAYAVTKVEGVVGRLATERSWNARLFTGLFLAAVLLVTTGFSARLVFYGHDGIFPTRAALQTFIEKRGEILALTEADAIIVADRADKYLFPFRRVVVPLRDERTYAALPLLVTHAPVYYFGITFPESDLAHLNEEKLFDLGLKIELVKTMSEESLYRITVR